MQRMQGDDERHPRLDVTALDEAQAKQRERVYYLVVLPTARLREVPVPPYEAALLEFRERGCEGLSPADSAHPLQLRPQEPALA